ncbi:MAG: hypothetical protein WAM13_05125 [Candidatus Sulfotelmatobacter sp.]
MACPFFMPEEKLENGNWLHAGRLPLGCGWSGQCSAPGHEGETPSHEELREFCNLGYAKGCSRLPREREWDSVRFAARTVGDAQNGTEGRIHVRYVCEREHRPAGSGTLEFDAFEARWVGRHRDDRVQRMAECFLQAFLEKKRKRAAAS